MSPSRGCGGCGWPGRVGRPALRSRGRDEAIDVEGERMLRGEEMAAASIGGTEMVGLVCSSETRS